MFRTTFLMIGILCVFTNASRAQQTGNNQNTNNNTGANTQTGGGTSGEAGLQIEGPTVSAEAAAAIQRQETGTVGVDAADVEEFAGVSGAGENASGRQNRQFTTRQTTQNLNQQSQNQPVYRTFGPNNVPYRAPHKIGFQVDRSRSRSVDLRLRRNVRILSSRRPEFANVDFVVSAADTVTLRGSVASENDRQMALLYVKMEPGINRVVNELQVSSAGPSVPPAPPTPSGQQ